MAWSCSKSRDLHWDHLSSICHKILMASCLTLSTVGHGSSGVSASLTLGHHFVYAFRTYHSRKVTPSPQAFARVFNLIVQETSQISELPCPTVWFALWSRTLTVQPHVFFQFHQHILAVSCSSSVVGVKLQAWWPREETEHGLREVMLSCRDFCIVFKQEGSYVIGMGRPFM